MRRALHDGHTARPLHEKATGKSCPQSGEQLGTGPGEAVGQDAAFEVVTKCRTRQGAYPSTLLPRRAAQISIAAGCAMRSLSQHPALGVEKDGDDVVVDPTLGIHDIVLLIQDRKDVDRGHGHFGAAPSPLQIHLEMAVMQPTVDQLGVAVRVQLPGLRPARLCWQAHCERVLSSIGAYEPWG